MLEICRAPAWSKPGTGSSISRVQSCRMEKQCVMFPPPRPAPILAKEPHAALTWMWLRASLCLCRIRASSADPLQFLIAAVSWRASCGPFTRGMRLRALVSFPPHVPPWGGTSGGPHPPFAGIPAPSRPRYPPLSPEGRVGSPSPRPNDGAESAPSQPRSLPELPMPPPTPGRPSIRRVTQLCHRPAASS